MGSESLRFIAAHHGVGLSFGREAWSGVAYEYIVVHGLKVSLETFTSGPWEEGIILHIGAFWTAGLSAAVSTESSTEWKKPARCA